MKKKNNLDEMQEQKLRRIESVSCWLGFWALVGAIAVQTAMGHQDWASIGGECAALFIMSGYLSISCLKNGIWDRKMKPDLKTNLLVSTTAAAVAGLVWFVSSYRNYHNLAGSAATFAFMFLSVFCLCMAGLSLVAACYRKRVKKLENQED